MSTTRAYRARSRAARPTQTRERIVAAVLDLLREGAFHESTMEEVAERAGVSRATLYQHFRSRLELVDSICDRLEVNPALVEIRKVVEFEDGGEALAELIRNSMLFWDSEDAVLRELYGVAAIDPAAQDFVDRQRADRRSEVERLARRLRSSKRLKPGVAERRALALMMMLTSYETYRELRQAGLSVKDLTRTLQDSGRELLLA